MNKSFTDLTMDPEQAKIKPRPCCLKKHEKEARLIALAEELHIKLGQPRQKRRQS